MSGVPIVYPQATQQGAAPDVPLCGPHVSAIPLGGFGRWDFGVEDGVVNAFSTGDSAVRWLLAGDVSIRWQVLRDLHVTPRAEWEAEQSKVAVQGWAARVLAHQDGSGRWTPRLYGQKWISTTYSMMLLRWMGLPRSDSRVVRPCLLFLDGALCRDGGINVHATQKRSETCVTGMALGILSWFGIDDPRRERLVDYLLREQMDDGGWNCLRCQGAVHSSFHTTINVLEGLREYAESGGLQATTVMAAESRAREFFLAHHLYRSHRTGEVVNPAFTRFSFPPRWHHDVLRTLDYFRASGAEYDDRLEDPVGVLLRKRRRDGRWVLQNRHPGKTFFEMERVSQPSRWNTLRGLRVLRWWWRVKEAI
jgi:hypothetical protein